MDVIGCIAGMSIRGRVHKSSSPTTAVCRVNSNIISWGAVKMKNSKPDGMRCIPATSGTYCHPCFCPVFLFQSLWCVHSILQLMAWNGTNDWLLIEVEVIIWSITLMPSLVWKLLLHISYVLSSDQSQYVFWRWRISSVSSTFWLRISNFQTWLERSKKCSTLI